ncbi:MAG: type II/IV secretion system protein [Solirubrobacteraceae bacterium]|nr:type II/IV secretion system protein [Solirubrobacteraceae bacterium]
MEPGTIPQTAGHPHDLTSNGATNGHATPASATNGAAFVPHVGDPFAGSAEPAVAAQDSYASLQHAEPVAQQPSRTPEEQAAWDEYERQQAEYERQLAEYERQQAAYAQQVAEQAAAEAPATDPNAFVVDTAPTTEAAVTPEPATAPEPALSSEEPAASAEDEDDFDDFVAEGLTRSRGSARAARSDVEAAIMLGLVTPEQVHDLQGQAMEAGRTVESLLIEQNVLGPEALARAVSERHGIDLVDLNLFKVDFAAANLIDPAAAKRYEALPVKMVDERTVLVAMVDPANIIVLDDISLMTGLDVRPVVASREDVATAISRLTRLDDVVTDDGTIEDREEDDGVVDLRGGSDDAPVIKLVNQIIAQAVERGTSDIHLQAGEFGLRVRYRIDGVLLDALDVPKKMAPGVVSRVKIMATLDIAERRIPQDGRISLTIDGHKLDLRVVTLPSVHGEAVIMRILDKSNVVMDLDILGMREREREAFETGFHQAYGAVLVTGPTGSGKSTTLYAALGAINTPEKNIITIEDPVEYQLHGVNQVQVNPKAGLTFANGLRALMRADPDVIMIGEIRDGETAQIAIESALTGHLVLSTLHTNDAPSAVSRLIEMGIEPFLIGSSIETIVAQRLARKLCKYCKQETELSVDVLKVNGFERDEPLRAWEPKGCVRCSNTGYKGRAGLYEVLSATDEIRELITARATADEIGAAARKAGMRTLREDGIAKVESGLTSIQEVARVCGTT